MKRAILIRKAGFWGAVAGVALLAQFGAELAADRLPFTSLRQFVTYIHRGPSSGSNA
jgi:hypothetical protein